MGDFFGYITHRYIFHNKYLYRYLHKTHHEYKNPTSILTLYADLIEAPFLTTNPLLLNIILYKYIPFNVTYIYMICFYIRQLKN